MSSARDKLTKRVASQTGGTAAPAKHPGEVPSGTNKYGDRLVQKFTVNTQQFARTFAGATNPGGNQRAGQRFQSGTTKNGRVVHYYKDGTRVVLNKKVKTGLSRGI